VSTEATPVLWLWGAVVAGYRAAGARAVVVSGVVDPAKGVHVDKVPNAVPTTCRLRADAGDLSRRAASCCAAAVVAVGRSRATR
jgi:hypothetical protein